MKKSTNLKRRKILLQSLPVAILAAIAFISLPSVLPENSKTMAESVAMIECREQYEITKGGKVVAVCAGIGSDSTLCLVREKADSDTERKAIVCGAWINRLSFVPSCGGRIFTVNPFAGDDSLLTSANSNIVRIIEKTIAQTRESIKTDRTRQTELDYYLSTHNVSDEGYNTMAEYAEHNKIRRKRMERGLELLESVEDGKGVSIRKKTVYTLLYSANGRNTSHIACQTDAEESRKHERGTIILRTADGFMPKECNSVYPFRLIDVSPEKGDSVWAAAVFGLSLRNEARVSGIKPSLFMGAATSANSHDIPQLLAPDGAPIFSRKGFFVGISLNGRIAK